MADKKISELVSITGSATAADDYFVVVDTSGAVTYKISREELNNAIEQDVLSSIEITDITYDVNVQGTVTADGLTVDGTAAINNILDMTGSTANYIKAATSGGDLRFITNEGGTNKQRIILSNNGDISFYDSTGTTQGLFWDASTQRLGIGDTTPDDTLTVYGGTAKLRIGSTDNNHIRIGRNTTSGNFEMSRTTSGATDQVFFKAIEANNGNIILQEGGGNVGVGTSSPSTTLDLVGSWVSNTGQLSIDTPSGETYSGLAILNNGTPKGFLYHDNSAGTLDLQTYTTDALRFKTNNTERMRITDAGTILVGKTAENTANDGIELNRNDVLVATRNNDAPLLLNRRSSDGEIAVFRKDNSTVGSIGTYSSRMYIGTGDVGLQFLDAADNILPINPSTPANRDGAIDLGAGSVRFKDLYLSGGVYLGGTGSANHLDDYEEGTWTPTYMSSNGGESVSYDVQKGGYVKIGKLVHIQLQLGTTSVSGGSGYIQIGGLPFANDGASSGALAVPIGLAYSFATTITGGSSAQVGTAELYFYKNDNAANVWSWTALGTGSSSNRVWISGTYRTT